MITKEWYKILYISSSLIISRTVDFKKEDQFYINLDKPSDDYEIMRTQLRISWNKDDDWKYDRNEKYFLIVDIFREKWNKKKLSMNVYYNNKLIKTITNKLINLFWIIPLNKEEVTFNFEYWILAMEDDRYSNNTLLENFVKNNYSDFNDIYLKVRDINICI